MIDQWGHVLMLRIVPLTKIKLLITGKCLFRKRRFNNCLCDTSMTAKCFETVFLLTAMGLIS